jgi:HSP20 family molecular chaperone IbpA
VFNEQGFMLPGAQVQVRRAGEKKMVAQDVANRGGEFWMHVARGAEYALTVKAPGFAEQTLKIESGSGDRSDLVIRLKRSSGEKKK